MAARRTDQDIHGDLVARIDAATTNSMVTLANVLYEVWEEESNANSEAPYDIVKCMEILRNDVETYNMTVKAWGNGTYKTLRNQWALYRHRQAGLEHVQKLIRTFTSRINKDLRKLANGDVTFDSWQPPANTPPEYAAFFKQLSVPCITDESGLPNLLIHQLGSYVAQEDVEQRVKRIFSQGFIGVCNASGSGKTRTLLEGLTLYWGFYFTMAKGPKGVGSSDWTNALEHLLSAPGFLSHVDPAAQIGEKLQQAYLTRNHKVVGMRADAVLLARIEIFREYLKLLPRSFTPADEVVFRTRWLMLQLDPKILPGFRNEDVFSQLSSEILDACQATVDPDALAAFVKYTMSEILDSRPSDSKPAESYLRRGSTVLEGPFHIVMDEVQAVASQYREAFRSAAERDPLTHELLPRPLFRAILMNVMERVKDRESVWVIPTGTNVSQADFATSVVSAGQQGNCRSEPVRYTGGLTTIDALEAYIRRYLPQVYLDSHSGNRLLQRIFTWLPGRYRFTAQYIFHLMGNGLRSPHRLLNSFVFAYTKGYVPTDAEDLIAQEPEYPLEEVGNSVNHVDLIDMRPLDADPDRRCAVFGVIRPMVHSYLLRSAADINLSSDDSAILVEVGFGHYASLIQSLDKPQPSDGQSQRTENQSLAKPLVSDRQPQRAEINEPLMVLRLATRLGMDIQFTAYGYFARVVGSSITQTSSDAWENFLAHCLLQLFYNKPTLSSVFNIVGTQTSNFAELMSCRAEFVGVVRANGTDVVGPVCDRHNPHVRRPSVTLGVSTASNDIANNNASQAERDKRKFEKTLDWLKKTPTPLLFPDTNMGPDLIAILRLNDKELCWLLLQAKLLTPEWKPSMGRYQVKEESVKDAIWSVTPECLYLSKTAHRNKTPQTAASLQKHSDAIAALKALPDRTAMAGECNALSAVAIFPGVSQLADFAKQVKPCASPLVELDFERFGTIFNQAVPKDMISFFEMSKQRFARQNYIDKKNDEREKRAQAQSVQHAPVNTGQKVDPVPKGHVPPRKDKIEGSSGKAQGQAKGKGKARGKGGGKKKHTGRGSARSEAPAAKSRSARSVAPAVPPNACDSGTMDELPIAGVNGSDLYSDFSPYDQDPGSDVGPPDTATIASGDTGQSSYAGQSYYAGQLFYSSALLGAAGPSHQSYPSNSNASASVATLSHSAMTPPALHHHSYSDSSVAGPSTLVIPLSSAYSQASSESARTPKRSSVQMDSDSNDGRYDVTGSPWKKPKYFN